MKKCVRVPFLRRKTSHWEVFTALEEKQQLMRHSSNPGGLHSHDSKDESSGDILHSTCSTAWVTVLEHVPRHECWSWFTHGPTWKSCFPPVFSGYRRLALPSTCGSQGPCSSVSHLWCTSRFAITTSPSFMKSSSNFCGMIMDYSSIQGMLQLPLRGWTSLRRF